jgi:asparagine synthase (glutamine-hydrolysing)
MCGIAGIIDLRGKWSRETLADIAARMADTMPHRGPDDRGVWVSPDGRCALAHRRLSIIDTSSGGHQPFHHPDGRHVVTFNGEIYNFLELREQLAARGHTFRTKSDTEVLVHLLAAEGVAALEALDGQFSFGLYDTAARTLLLGRDPFGEKPLYWSEGPGWFAFASELHALPQVPDFDASIDGDTIAEYLALQYVDAPRSIYRHAHKLRPGHWLQFDAAGQTRIGRHFAFRPRGPVRSARPMQDLADELESILLRLVRRRMIADVPLGAFLSGGVDSSTVVALMSKALGRRVKTFSIGFENAPDETEHLFARQMAEHLGTEHHEQVLEVDVLPLLESISKRLDEPNGDSSCLPTFLVSQLARQHVTVSLSGDGGDEMFGGYGRYFATLQDEARQRQGFDAGRIYYSSRVLTYVDEHIAELFGQVPPRTAALLASLRRQLTREPGPLLHKMRQHDAVHYMPGAVLPKVDRMSMQHSLEVRTPFLSRELAAFCEQLAVDDCYEASLLGGPQGKLVLKELAQRYIPRDWLDRRKMGFGVPTKAGWGKDRMVAWLRELTLGNDAKLAQWIDRRGREAFADRMTHSFSFYQAWVMLLLEQWLRAHPCQRGDAATTPALERRSLAELTTGDLRPEDLLLWQRLAAATAPAAVFCSEELPPWIGQLRPGSTLVTVDPIEVPAGLHNLVCAWHEGQPVDVSSLEALSTGPAVFTTPIHEVHADLLGLLAERGTEVVHRVGERWVVRRAATTAGIDAAAGHGGASLGERWFGHRVAPRRPGEIQAAGGRAFRVALPALARERALDRTSRLVVLEDGHPLPHGESSPAAVARFGRGRYAIEGEWLWFAPRDDSDPTSNGRHYLAVLRGPRRGLLHQLGATPLGHLALTLREGFDRWLARPGARQIYRFRRPFRHDGGTAYIASLRRSLVPLSRLRDGWRVVVLEDGRPLPLPDSVHEDVRRLGGGRHSVWEGHVWFSASDGSNPNHNGRSYAVALVAPGERFGGSSQGDETPLDPALRNDAEFLARLAELASEPVPPAPALGPGSRVVMVIGTLHTGGSERQLCNLAVQLDRRGLEVTILVLTGTSGAMSPYRALLAPTGVKVVAADTAEPCIDLGGLAKDDRRLQLLAALPDGPRGEIWRIFTRVAALRPDALHCCLDGPNTSGGVAGLLAGVPRIGISVRSMSPLHFPQHSRPWFRDYYRLLATSPRLRLSANSEDAADSYAAWSGIPRQAFRIIPNGIDGTTLADAPLAARTKFRGGLGIPMTAPLVAGLQRFSEEKQPLVFLRAIALARQRVPGLRAVIAGAGPLLADAEAELGRLGLCQAVHLLGTRKDVATILGAADVVMLTSRNEGCPNVLLEAQWLGRPVVAANVPGCRNAVRDGESGILCAEPSPEAFADALVTLLSAPELCARLGRGAATFARARYALDSMVDSTLTMYRA